MLIDVFDASKTFPLAVGRLELQRDVNDPFISLNVQMFGFDRNNLLT